MLALKGATAAFAFDRHKEKEERYQLTALLPSCACISCKHPIRLLWGH
jgi:hypothetical protein